MVWPSAARAVLLYSNSIDGGPNQGGTNMYGFAFKCADNQDGGSWSQSYLPHGGDRGTGDGAVQVTMAGNHWQYRFGWATPSFTSWNPVRGDRVFIRFRLKFPSGQPPSRDIRNKFISFGSVSDGTDNTFRVITFMTTPASRGCGLDQDTPDYTGTYTIHHRPGDYGITLPGNDWGNNRYAAIAVNRNIEGPRGCAVPPILLAPVDSPNRGTPGYVHNQFGTGRGGVASDGWYHVQIEVRSGTAGNAYFKQWANENNYNTPTSLQNPLRYSGGSTPMGLAATGWNGGMNVGSHMDTPPSSAFTYILDDFQVDTEFDPTWYPGGTPPPPPPPPPPSGSRCDVDASGATNVTDVQLCVNQAIGILGCATGDIDLNGSCNVVDVQRVVNAALGGICVTP